MTNQDAESGLELVLDNKKLILAFTVLIAICGCFFVVGFMEGKRQGYQEGSQTAADSLPKPPVAAQAQPRNDAPSQSGEAAKEYPAAEQQLNWFSSVNRREGEPEGIASAAKPDNAPPKPSAPAAAEPRDDAEPVIYSVQVGAFRKKEELEIRAQMLREKGFNYRIDPPSAPDGLYLLKVGTFRSRAEAAAMQLRLKKSGFASFIKMN